ncbi:MAG: DNA translocase FtsK [Planctomycetes bacterium]|nr:DNA translocase FtsK [Planctomycetota bacterium]
MRRELVTRVMLGLLLGTAGLFVAVSLATWSPSDPQVFPNYPVNPVPVNRCGVVGAKTASYLLYLHGIAAFIIPVLVVGMGAYVMLAKPGRLGKLLRMLGGVLLLGSVSFLLGLVFRDGFGAGMLGWLTPAGPGGVWGVVPSKYALYYLGGVGAVFLGIVSVVAAFFLMAPDVTLKAMAGLGKGAMGLAKLPGRLKAFRFSRQALPAAAGATAVEVMTPEDAEADMEDADAGDGEEGEEGEGDEEEQLSFEVMGRPSRSRKPRGKEKKRKSVRKAGPGAPVQTGYTLPPISLIDDEPEQDGEGEAVLAERGRMLVETLMLYGVPAELVDVHEGPSVTLYEVRVKEGVKLGKVVSLSGEIAMRLKARTQRVRIIAPIPRKGTVGVEVPNRTDRLVKMKPIMMSPGFRQAKERMALPIIFGRDNLGDPVIGDLAAMPHLLIGGATNSGKSVCMNSIIVSLLMQKTPDEMRMILIDPKQVELTAYQHLSHLYTPVVTEVRRAVKVLDWACMEMEERYTTFHRVAVRNLEEYNRMPHATRCSRAGFDEETDEIPGHIPYVVIVVDEIADLMAQAGKEVEHSIQRLAQKARAAGIHIVFATQRPSADVVKGTIKANFPAVVAFNVSNAVNSRVILDETGAEALLGKGDMLFRSPSSPNPVRAKGVFMSDEETDRVVAYWRAQKDPEYSEEIEEVMNSAEEGEAEADFRTTIPGLDDKSLDEAVQFVIETERASASSLQAQFGFGYPRANKLIQAMYALGVVGETRGSKFREVYMTLAEWAVRKEELLAGEISQDSEDDGNGPLHGEEEEYEELDGDLEEDDGIAGLTEDE